MKNNIVVCIDFDGTCVTHDYPRIGKDIGSIPVLEQLIDKGHKLVLFSMRSGKELKEAVKWFEDNDLELYGVQENPTQKSWTTSPKAYGQLYIDDAALGCPLVYDPSISNRPFVSWKTVEKMLKDNKIL